MVTRREVVQALRAGVVATVVDGRAKVRVTPAYLVGMQFAHNIIGERIGRGALRQHYLAAADTLEAMGGPDDLLTIPQLDGPDDCPDHAVI